MYKYLANWLCICGLLISTCHLSAEISKIDVAIIGGGVSGVYCGNKLRSQQKLNVHVFEGTNRIGGRLYSVFLPGMEHIPVELGGMRFKGNHELVVKLVDELGLKKVPFSHGESNNLLFLRGVNLHKNDLKDTSKLPYHLAENEKGKSTQEIMSTAVSQIVPNYNKLSRDEWIAQRDTLHYEGKLLKDVSWINFLSSQLSSEAFQLFVDIGEISLISDTSALYILDTMIGDVGSGLYKLTEGYQAIPLRLAEKFQEQGGGLHLEHMLTDIVHSTENQDYGYDLTFENGKGEKTHYLAKKIILTISPTALMQLLPNTPLSDQEKLKSNLNSVSPNVLTKLFLAYREPWWRALNLTEGNSQTEKPIRSCYYFPSEADFTDNDSKNSNSLLLASYQGSFNSLWQSMNRIVPFPQTIDRSLESLKAGTHAVVQAQFELKLLHQVEVPMPYAAIFQDWGKAPYHAAYYFWNVGVNPWHVDRDIRKPSEKEEIYIFTSDFCEHQGWVECALVTADRLLKEFFGD